MPKGSGRRPLPTAVKKLRGNPGKRKLNEKEPTIPAGEPAMPKHLSKVAIAEWKSIVPELLRLGVLTVVDGKALAAYCAAFARWIEAEEAVDEFGLVVEEPILLMGTATGFVRLKRNPAISISHDAMKIMKAFLVEFGMTPASRSRIRVEKPEGKEDPTEAFIRRKLVEAQGKHVN